jgi:hypothetical protein
VAASRVAQRKESEHEQVKMKFGHRASLKEQFQAELDFPRRDQKAGKTIPDRPIFAEVTQ